ncbi:hypothetical protein LRHMDP2_2513 [Lacticaseibacillus rhamnosus LRHMDP2]|nr:hypothetical protein LRHMDP2_2513 [Lacticaseibacillus rhamnosus LRHMDP2]
MARVLAIALKVPTRRLLRWGARYGECKSWTVTVGQKRIFPIL